MNSKEVVSVTIYNADLAMLFIRGKTLSPDARRVTPLGRVQSLTIVETPDYFEFTEPILINLAVKSDESLYFGYSGEGSAGKVIGCTDHIEQGFVS
jgi:hypothetical protein